MVALMKNLYYFRSILAKNALPHLNGPKVSSSVVRQTITSQKSAPDTVSTPSDETEVHESLSNISESDDISFELLIPGYYKNEF